MLLSGKSHRQRLILSCRSRFCASRLACSLHARHESCKDKTRNKSTTSAKLHSIFSPALNGQRNQQLTLQKQANPAQVPGSPAFENAEEEVCPVEGSRSIDAINMSRALTRRGRRDGDEHPLKVTEPSTCIYNPGDEAKQMKRRHYPAFLL